MHFAAERDDLMGAAAAVGAAETGGVEGGGDVQLLVVKLP